MFKFTEINDTKYVSVISAPGNGKSQITELMAAAMVARGMERINLSPYHTLFCLKDAIKSLKEQLAFEFLKHLAKIALKDNSTFVHDMTVILELESYLCKKDIVQSFSDEDLATVFSKCARRENNGWRLRKSFYATTLSSYNEKNVNDLKEFFYYED